jgi:hypothetical protein
MQLLRTEVRQMKSIGFVVALAVIGLVAPPQANVGLIRMYRVVT